MVEEVEGTVGVNKEVFYSLFHVSFVGSSAMGLNVAGEHGQGVPDMKPTLDHKLPYLL